MTFETFEDIQTRIFNSVHRMNDTKGKEYVHTEDRFDNFNRLALELQLDRKVVWQVYFAKHMDAIKTYIRTGQSHSEESIQGRIVDAITYLTLLAGMIEEEETSTQPSLFDAVEGLMHNALKHKAQQVEKGVPGKGVPSAADLDKVEAEKAEECLNIMCILPTSHTGPCRLRESLKWISK